MKSLVWFALSVSSAFAQGGESPLQCRFSYRATTAINLSGEAYLKNITLGSGLCDDYENPSDCKRSFQTLSREDLGKKIDALNTDEQTKQRLKNNLDRVDQTVDLLFSNQKVFTKLQSNETFTGSTPQEGIMMTSFDRHYLLKSLSELQKTVSADAYQYLLKNRDRILTIDGIEYYLGGSRDERNEFLEEYAAIKTAGFAKISDLRFADAARVGYPIKLDYQSDGTLLDYPSKKGSRVIYFVDASQAKPRLVVLTYKARGNAIVSALPQASVGSLNVDFTASDRFYGEKVKVTVVGNASCR